MRLIIGLLFFAITPALAQTPSSSTQPAPIGKTHQCVHYYPREAVRAHSEGKTTLAFTVTAQGTVTNVAVESSSGHASLDNASISCVSQWQYQPATKNGAAVDVPLKASVTWQLGGFPDIGRVFAAAANNCTGKAQIDKDAAAMATGPTVAKIGFYRDDAPAIDIEQSSGSEALDQLLLRCLANVPPNIQIHPPFKMQFKVTFSWKPNAAAAASQAQSEAASPSPVKQ